MKNAILKTSTASALLVSFLLGFQGGGFQFGLMEIANDFALSATVAGSLVTVQAGAMAVGPLISGPLADRIGKRYVLAGGLVLFIGGCGLVWAAGSVAMLVVALMLNGAGFILMEGLILAALTEENPGRGSKLISISQSLFSVGAVCGPLITSALIGAGLTWRVTFQLSGAGALLVMLHNSLYLWCGLPVKKAAPAAKKGRSSRLRVDMPLVLLMAAILCYVGTENSAGFYLNPYFTQGLGRGDIAALGISLFWLAMVPARFLGGYLTRLQNRIIPLGFFGAAVLLVLLSLVHSGTLGLVLCLLAGWMMGAVWPFLVSIAAERYSEHSATAIGYMQVSGSAGGALLPFLMGVVSDHGSVRMVFALLGLCSFLGFVVFLGFLRGKRKTPAEK